MNPIATIVLFLLILVVVYGVSYLLVHFFVFGWGTDHPDNIPTEEGCKKAKTMKEYAKLVDDMECKGDDIDVKKFLNKYNKSMNSKQIDCVIYRADLGDELYENEILHCYEDWK